jgi:branched-chain amino acid transport system substrate-binding protein
MRGGGVGEVQLLTKFRLFKLVSVAVLFAMVAAACGGADDPDPGAAQPTEPTEVGETDDAADDGEPVAEPEGDPIRVGGSLALTGFLGPTGVIHRLAGEQFVDRLNEQGGLLGRPVEWVVLDDESVPDRAAAAYERLITEEEVDLIMGPYATGPISAAIRVAERFGYLFPHHSGSLTYTYDYECNFSSWSSGRYPNQTVMEEVLNMLESVDNPPETIGFVVNRFPGTNYLAYGSDEGDDDDAFGAVEVARNRGFDVVLNVNYPTDIADWGPIAQQVRDADPDFVWHGATGLDAINLIEEMEALNYRPGGEFYLWPAPAPLVAAGDIAEGMFKAGMFEPTEARAEDPEVQEIMTEFSARAEAAGVYPVFDTQAAASWTAWEYLVAAVEGTQSLEHDQLCDYLQTNAVDTTFLGQVEFNADRNNYADDFSVISQLVDGEWVVVWPPDRALPGNEPIFPWDR